jgi:hypothetical protein
MYDFFPASVAVFVRQTNIVWVAFIAFLSLSHVLKLHVLQCNGKLSPKVLKSAKYLQVSVSSMFFTVRNSMAFVLKEMQF